jgi:hypothetical protein
MLLSIRSPLALALLLTLAAGCGDGRNSAPVSGKVTVNGQPLADIIVNYQPVGGGSGSTGLTDSAGQYTLSFVDTSGSGALVGKHQVTFADKLAAKDQGDGGALPKQKHRIPPRYSSEAQDFEVPKGGTSAANFDLK